ncbi:Polysaccharide pyruvyl transferase [Bacteroides faecichinchillae]|uniref:Polysaccharide pyruvyl transferase n=1 Tax=Bacteroides faecichinchillae TaxID=871325 RepID=A0A1M4YYI8_9BACE|nr:polysaccharide pyruvyl transferase family protein [Bacteroides faecichinchillae]SHF10810.1 Polysaccharide pyruvyl transferase [Bacteroides faecichinchillae]
MKVGIITYHRAHNYGAVLQCYALQEVLKRMGHDTQIIDYRQPFIEKLYNLSKKELFFRYKFHPRALMARYAKQKAIKSFFENFSNDFLQLSDKCAQNAIPEYEVYIVGSDQMWSLDCVGGKIDPIYFGMFDRSKNSRLIGFSISSNIHSIGILNERINQYIDNFDAISFREQTVADTISEIVSKKMLMTLDPTLCTDAELWSNVINHGWNNRKYIALYHVMFRFSPAVHDMLYKQACRIAKKNRWEIIDLSTGEYSVSDFVSVIKYAQCVITSSFHATVFSVIFSRPLFAVQLHDGNDGRYVSLLNSLNMANALVDLDFIHESPVKIDYDKVHTVLLHLRESSLEYLKLNIR